MVRQGLGTNLRNDRRNDDAVLGNNQSKVTETFDDTIIPVYERYGCIRTAHKISVIPQHEPLHEELHTDPSVNQRLRQRVSAKLVPPCYHENCVLKGSPEDLVQCCCHYFNGVSCNSKDSMIAFVFHFVVPQ